MSNRILWGAVGGCVVGIIVASFSLYHERSAPNLPQWQSAGGPKRYVIYNAKQFERKPGVSAMSVSTLSAMGAKNIKQMELINGASFEGDPSRISAFAAQAAGGEWRVQEDKEDNHVLAFSCSRCETIPCPSDPVVPEKVCVCELLATGVPVPLTEVVALGPAVVSLKPCSLPANRRTVTKRSRRRSRSSLPSFSAIRTAPL